MNKIVHELLYSKKWKAAAPEGSSQHSETEIRQGQNIEPVYHWEIVIQRSERKVRAKEQRSSECPNKVGNK